jgi:hypothetical protein
VLLLAHLIEHEVADDFVATTESIVLQSQAICENGARESQMASFGVH